MTCLITASIAGGTFTRFRMTAGCAAENTRKTISTDGFCYTGDLGFYDENGLPK